jgi:two-component system, NarL family, nitrate/nitrite response regulator NarL
VEVFRSKPGDALSNVDAKIIRLLIVDDHKLFGAGLCLLVDAEPGMKVVGHVGTSVEALAIAANERPNLILLDLDLDGVDGSELIPGLRTAAKEIKIIVITGNKDVRAHRDAVRQGAAGLVLKDSSPAVLLKAIRKVDEGELWVDRVLMSDLHAEITEVNNGPSPSEDITKLTQRERAVIALIAEGLKNKQIAERMFISETTVSHHLTSVFTKLGVTDRLELVIYAFAHGLAKIPR